jgi:ATP-dependent DNA helicase PIF1
MLLPEQQQAISVFHDGGNMFITGPAGTGKSFVLHHLIRIARAKYSDVGVTASTGLAAFHLKGRTIHSFLGLGLGKKSPEVIVAQMRKNKPLLNRLKRLQVLFIDEISMIDAELLDKISSVLCMVRERSTNVPFGGVQMVFCGDFCQLPPVQGEYCFLADTWKAARIHICMLNTLVRQDGDCEFQRILGELRWGVCSKDTLEVLRGRIVPADDSSHVRPTLLYSKNIDVDEINTQVFTSLVEKGATHINYTTKYTSHPFIKQWATSLRIPESVDICINAQVLITHNSTTDSSIVNGTRGVVSNINKDSVEVELVNGERASIGYVTIEHDDVENAKVTFMPLRLAYAITIHKSQGMTLDAVEMDLGKSIFEYGQAYTALSRAKSLDSVRILSVTARSFKTDPRVVEFYKNIEIKQ